MSYDHLSTFKHETEARPNQCVSCHWYFSADDIACTLDDGAGTLGMLCAYCAKTETGHKFDSPESVILYAWSMDSMQDDWMANEGWGHCARFGRWLLMEDSQGFVSAQEYQDVAAAEKEYNELYSQGWGADESDAYIYFDRGAWHLSIDYQEVGKGYERETRARAAMSLEARRTGYYPNLWRQDERGSVTNLSYW